MSMHAQSTSRTVRRAWTAPAILVRDLHKSYGPSRPSAGIDFEVARGEVFGLLGPNGAGKTTTVEILEGYRERTSGIVSVLGHDPGQRAARAARARRDRPAGQRDLPPRHRPRAARALGRPLPGAARRRRGARARRARRARRDVRTRPPVRRPAAAPGLRARARRRPRADLPRRADDRLRPRGAPRGVADDPLARRPRQDRPAHHALPRRGAGAVRPRRDRQGRPDPRHRRAGRARQRRRAATASPGATGDGELVDARDRRPDRAAAPADLRGARPRRAAARPVGHAARRSRTSTSSWSPRRPRRERRRRASPGASTASSAGCSGATRARRSSTSSCRCSSSRCSARSTPATRRTSTSSCPGIAGMSVVSTTFVALAHNLVFLREQGVLKRLRGTPLPAGAYLGALAGARGDQRGVQLAIVDPRRPARSSASAGREDWLALAVFADRRRRRASRCSASRSPTRSPTSTRRRPTSTRRSCRSSRSAASSTTPRTSPAFLRDIAEALPLTHLIDGLSRRDGHRRVALVGPPRHRPLDRGGRRARGARVLAGRPGGARRGERRRRVARDRAGPRPAARGSHSRAAARQSDVVDARRRGGGSARSVPSRRQPSFSSARCERGLLGARVRAEALEAAARRTRCGRAAPWPRR